MLERLGLSLEFRNSRWRCNIAARRRDGFPHRVFASTPCLEGVLPSWVRPFGEERSRLRVAVQPFCYSGAYVLDSLIKVWSVVFNSAMHDFAGRFNEPRQATRYPVKLVAVIGDKQAN